MGCCNSISFISLQCTENYKYLFGILLVAAGLQNALIYNAWKNNSRWNKPFRSYMLIQYRIIWNPEYQNYLQQYI